ncbi:MAG TPA: glucose 1-dehydrogenase [Candidatus Dormibacteraeota bacterium]|nr:glucose 1-dehydrogenase [Candidatus Dormibacteraeota bacterium]
MARLEGKVAVVTGAGSGIGRAIALVFATQGAQVLAADRDGPGLEETVGRFQKSSAGGPGELEMAIADISLGPDVAGLVERAESTWGKLTTWCSNAGISMAGTVEETSEDDLDRILAVNLRGPFLGAKHAIPAMRRAGGGSIINTGSVNSFLAERALCAYTTSKGGVLMLTKSIAVDYASEGIRCNCLCPGFVDTPINVPHYNRLGGIDKIRASLPEWIPAGRGGEPEEMAYAALYLASDDSLYVTGTAMVVDGGLSAGA